MNKIMKRSTYGDHQFKDDSHDDADGTPKQSLRRTNSHFKMNARVVLQSIKEEVIHGTVRWTGPVIIDGQPITAVGIETVTIHNLK